MALSREHVDGRWWFCVQVFLCVEVTLYVSRSLYSNAPSDIYMNYNVKT